MRQSLYAFLIIICCLCSGCGKTRPDELPMHGGVDFTSGQKKIIEMRIQDAVKQFGDRKTAAEKAVESGWYYYNHKHDPKNAMRWFNQAWLFDPNNAGAFDGFGFLMAEKSKEDEAITYYKKSIELNPRNALGICNLGRIYKNRAYRLYRQRKREEMLKNIDEAMKLYEKASQVATIDGDLGYIYYQWAVALELTNNYAEAWKKIKLARKHDGQFIEPRFIKELLRYMPESQE